MTKDELIRNGKHKVRNTPDLMRYYISLFKEEFGYEPKCAGCTFSNDWDKFVRRFSVREKKEKIMAGKTFVLRDNKVDIISYKKDKRTYRAYTNTADDDFVINWLTYGNEADLEERKKRIKTFPENFGLGIAPEMQDFVNSTKVDEEKPKRTRKPKNK